jgi:hypothetical protein
MASVVTFWQLPCEEERFLRFLTRGGDVVAIRHMEAVVDRASIHPLPVGELIGRADTRRLYLTLRSVTAGSLELHRWEPKTQDEPVRYSLPSRFPAIMYDIGTLTEGRLSQSNAAAYPSYAPPAVAAWFSRVFAWLRRASPQWHEYRGYRCTELVLHGADEAETEPGVRGH